MSLSQPAALGPSSPSLQLLAGLFQNPVRMKRQHSIFLGEKLNSRGKGCRVSIGLGWMGENKRMGQLSLLWYLLHLPWSSHRTALVQRVILSKVCPRSSLQHHLPSKPSPKPRGGAQSCATCSCPGGMGLHSHPVMP